MRSGQRPIHLLQFGASGQLALEMTAALSRKEEIVPVIKSRRDVDFGHPEQVTAAVLSEKELDIVVNTVAYTAVDKAETDKDLAQRVNSESVGKLAEACLRRNVPLIHVSTDYVYDGKKETPYVESDQANPLNVYGATKLAGEELIRKTLDAHVILRTSWIYSAHGTNFVKTMLRLGTDKDELRIIDDQWGAPTAASSLSTAIIAIVGHLAANKAAERFGTFHYTSAGATTWRRFAEECFRLATWANIRAKVVPIKTIDYPLPALRPANSQLDTAKVRRAFGLVPPKWQDSLRDVLAELKECSK